MKQQICKRTVSYFLIAMMVIISLWIACPKQASAAAVAYRDTQVLTRTEDGVSRETPREKIAGYYFWEESKGSKSILKCAKTLTAKGTTLATSEKGTFRNTNVVTNGTTVFFSVNGLANWTQAVIYKTTVKGGSAKKIKEDKNAASIDLYTYYNGKLYFNRGCTGGYAYPKPYSYHIAAKKMKFENKLPYSFSSGYGKYITAFYHLEQGHDEDGYVYLYNIATGKLKKLAKADDAAVSGSKVYIQKMGNSASMYTIKSCSLSGKNLKTIKTVKNVEYCDYFGKSKAIFKIKGKSALLKVTYQ